MLVDSWSLINVCVCLCGAGWIVLDEVVCGCVYCAQIWSLALRCIRALEFGAMDASIVGALLFGALVPWSLGPVL